MTSLLLFLASLSWGQLAQDTTSYQQTVSPDFEQTLSNLGKDVRELQSGRPTVTGIPLFQDGFCIGTRSTCQTTAGGTAPTMQVFTSGSGTYTTPAGATAIVVRMVGGGGGGGSYGSSCSVTATAGGDTTFNSIEADGGEPGALDINTNVIGGVGGTGGAGSATIRWNGVQGGGAGPGNNDGIGGGSILFGGGGLYNTVNAGGRAGVTNSGGGGSGGVGNTNYGGSGGGGGESVIYRLGSPSGTYSYAVGAAGVGCTSDQGYVGGAGGSGIIIVDEYY